MALAFCAGLRRSEIAALVWGDITPTARAGQQRVRVRSSKTNADGRREDLGLLAGPFARPHRREPARGDVSGRGRPRRTAWPTPGQPAPVQATAGWRSAAMVARYASAVAVEDGAVARLFGGAGP